MADECPLISTYTFHSMFKIVGSYMENWKIVSSYMYLQVLLMKKIAMGNFPNVCFLKIGIL